VGPAGTLATVGPPSSSDRESRPRGSLTLSFVQPGTPVVGDLVQTLGSLDERPYAAGVLVGTVTSVDPDRGELTRTATVRPVVDPDAVDVVAVLVPRTRTSARAEAPQQRATP
jgi:rod shape-determining protein MreC